MAWFENAKFYQFYPLAFANRGDYGLCELEKWVSHLKSLKIDAVYLAPLFQSRTHGYDTEDYFSVDSRLGDNQTLINLVNTYHKNDIKVVVDGVFNHVGRYFFAFQDVIRKRENSNYVDWFKNIRFDCDNHYGDGLCYEGWEGCDDLVLLNLENPAVVDYLMSAVDFWIKTFKIDGIRLDCAYSLPKHFLNRLNKEVKRNSEFYLLGEVIHDDYSSYISDNLLDSVTDYELHQALFNCHNTKNYFELAHTLKRQFSDNKGKTLYNFVDNHDVNRLSSKVVNKNHLYLIYSILYFLPGCPSLYYGSEWGTYGKKENGSDDNLRPYFDINNLPIDNLDLLEIIKGLSYIRDNDKSFYAKSNLNVVLLENEHLILEREAEGRRIYLALNCGENIFYSSKKANKIIYGKNFYEEESLVLKKNSFVIFE